MSEGEFKKLRIHLRLLTICVIVLIALLAANLVHRTVNPRATSFPKVQVVNGKDGMNARVDYDKINQLVQAQVAALPSPQNGMNGTNGTNGQSVQGVQGIPGVGMQGIPGVGVNGKDGSNVPPMPVLQVQVDPSTCQLQTKYDTSDFWTSIAQLPKPCGVL